MKSFMDRTRERKLFQWLAAYMAVALVALSATGDLKDIWGWPSDFAQAITLALGIGVFPASVIAWYHGEKGRQDLCFREVLVLGLLAVAGAVLVWGVCYRGL
jgi:hypothetical protein